MPNAPLGGENPYSPTQKTTPTLPSGGAIDPSNLMSRGLVGQVQILGVLMIVQGVLVSLAAIVIGFYAAFMPTFLEQMRQNAAAQGGNNAPVPPEFGSIMMIVGGVITVLILTLGFLHIYCGIRTMQFRGRVFSMVVLCCGLLTLITCYCLPTQLALSIYGLIVLLNAPVCEAFRYAERGHTPREIQQAYLSLP
ncbi:hypothetical protein [Novipirellula artificiosorum]|uniref:DUF4064 domain-containing protein n=1 Tax=Novipirellula artificiosorum TaxID=2528016 RepID=A0A5C6DJL4_9BACT|nr:hypothetical protein [Novipirellula artificiosorum]TWU36097.1 hypothetical protein Poly41_38500 [Novipirellula artificiosorum]